MITFTWEETPPKTFKTIPALLRFIDSYCGIWPCCVKIVGTEVTYHLTTQGADVIYKHLGNIEIT